jgi:hypothetical protein
MDWNSVRTSYDVATKQHWLSVYRRKLKSRFLLKDSSKKTNDPKKVNRKISGAVKKLIAALAKDITVPVK